MNTILCFGDSLTYGAWDPEGGWVARLRRELERQGDWLVYNLGISGNNSQLLMERIEDEIKRRQRNLDERLVIIVQMGTNDSQVQVATGTNEIPLPTFKENVTSIVNLCKKYTSHILLMGPGIVNEEKVNPLPWDPVKGYKNKDLAEYSKVLEELAERLGVRFVEIRDELDKTDLDDDGLHWNERGHEKVKKLVLESIKDWIKLDVG